MSLRHSLAGMWRRFLGADGYDETDDDEKGSHCAYEEKVAGYFSSASSRPAPLAVADRVQSLSEVQGLLRPSAHDDELSSVADGFDCGLESSRTSTNDERRGGEFGNGSSSDGLADTKYKNSELPA